MLFPAPGDKVAYRMAGGGATITNAELEAESNRAAHLFRHHGLEPGDGIAILLENHPRYLQIAWGAQRSGLYYTPVSVLFQRQEIDYILTNSDARLFVTSAAQLHKVSPEVLSRLTATHPPPVSRAGMKRSPGSPSRP